MKGFSDEQEEIAFSISPGSNDDVNVRHCPHEKNEEDYHREEEQEDDNVLGRKSSLSTTAPAFPPLTVKQVVIMLGFLANKKRIEFPSKLDKKIIRQRCLEDAEILKHTMGKDFLLYARANKAYLEFVKTVEAVAEGIRVAFEELKKDEPSPTVDFIGGAIQEGKYVSHITRYLITYARHVHYLSSDSLIICRV